MTADQAKILATTTELVASYMSTMQFASLLIDEDCAQAYADFIKTIYKTVEELAK